MLYRFKPFHFKGPMILRVYKNHVEIFALNFGVDLFLLNENICFDTHLDARYSTFWYLQFAIDELMVRLFLIVSHSKVCGKKSKHDLNFAYSPRSGNMVSSW